MMLEHCPGVYELEFQRLYRMQGHTIYKLRHWYKQLNCYNCLYDNIQQRGNKATKLKNRILRLIDTIIKYEKRHAILESEKEEVSSHNPENAEYAKYERIIQAAYERAYENQQ